jgi:hypothetical protein
VVTGKYLWSANPESGRVALVDASTYRVVTRTAGQGASVVAPIPGADGGEGNSALVLNTVAETASWLHTDDTPTQTLPTHARANAWAVSPSGKWAMAWTDARRVADADPTEGFQDLSLLLLRPSAAEGKAPRSTRHGNLGFRPSSVVYGPNEQRAYIVTEDGISVLELGNAASPAVTSLIPVGDALEDPREREVVIAPGGTHAFARTTRAARVNVLDLEGGESAELALPAPVTDLDVSATGTLAVAVLADASQIAVLRIPAVLNDPKAVELVSVPGKFASVSLAQDGSTAVLYTNGVPTSRVATVDLRAGESYLSQRALDLKAPVRGVFVAADAEHALALLEPPAGSVKPGAFAVIPTRRPLSPRIVGTDAKATAVAMTPGAPSDSALVTVRDDAAKTYAVYAVSLRTLQVDRIGLGSPPLSLGLVPAVNKGFVAQEHPEGRLTFIELPDPEAVADGFAPRPSARTLTGFELAAKITYPERSVSVAKGTLEP